MSLADGQRADAVNFNAAYLSKAIGGTTLGIIDLFDASSPISGARVENVQQAINEIFATVGMTGIGDVGSKTYSSTHYVSNGDEFRVAIGKLDTAIFGSQASVVSKLDKPGVSTAAGVPRFTDALGQAIQSTGVTIDVSNNLDVPGNLTIHGDFSVLGTQTTVNSASLDVTDANITVNKNGTNSTSEGAGLTVDRAGIKGSFKYANALASRFKIGDLGSEKEVVDVSSIQTLINKVIDAALNTITNITDAAISATAAIARTKLASGNADWVLINDGSGVMSQEQYLDKSRGGSGQSNSGLLFPSLGTLITDGSVATLTNKSINADANPITNLVDANIKSTAAIARSKVASGSINHVVVNNGAGVLASEAQLAKVRGGSGQDNSLLIFPSSGELAVVPNDTVFTLANNVDTQNVTGLILDKSLLRFIEVKWSVYRKSAGGQTRAQCGSFYAIHDDTNCSLTDGSMSGSYAGVTFEINQSTGQITYTTDDNGGTYSSITSVLKYKIVNSTGV